MVREGDLLLAFDGKLTGKTPSLIATDLCGACLVSRSGSCISVSGIG